MTNVLLVDDSISFHSMIELFLRQSAIQRYKLLSVTSAEAMFELLQCETEVGLILLDISLPDMNGIAACKRLREEYPHIPAIIITAKLDRNLVEIAAKAGAADFLIKPFDGASLRSRIQHAISVAV